MKTSVHPQKICNSIEAVIATNTKTGRWFKAAYLSWYFDDESVCLKYFDKLNEEHAQLFIDMLMLRKRFPWYEDKFHALMLFLTHFNKDNLLGDIALKCTETGTNKHRY